jgi:Spy/CpxP family protein refolding chaperone
MKHRKLTVVIATALLCASLAFAQETSSAAPSSTTPSSTPKAYSGRFNLGLTQEQKTQLQNLRTSMRDQMAIIKHDSTLSQEQQQQQIQQLRQTTRAQMNAVFTPEQQQKLAQMKAAHQARLGLTDAQKTQLKSLFSGAHQQREAVLNNSALSSAQKQTQLQQIRQSTQTPLSSILTPEQLQKMHSMRHGWGGFHHGPADGGPAASN